MEMKVMVCGVDCKPNRTECNGYCMGESDEPPAATDEQRMEWARKHALRALAEAEKVWREYAKVSTPTKPQVPDTLATLQNLVRVHGI